MKRSTETLALVVLIVGLLPTPVALAAPCTAAQRAAILRPAERGGETALVDCDLELTRSEAAAISRVLVFEGARSSRVTLDCNGGTIHPRLAFDLLGDAERDTIEIRSRKLDSFSLPGVPEYEPVVGVTIRDCEVQGSIRIFGMGTNVKADEPRASSHQPGHVDRIRAAAPRYITLDNVTIVGMSRGSRRAARIPLYISGGVRDTLVTHSHITGISNSSAVYLEAESTRTTIRNSTIDASWSGAVGSRSRELISIDASDHNRIIGNWLSSLETGGIYLYRNCGERGTVRITTPSHNEIINNIFYYDTYDGNKPAVSIGARNGSRDGDDVASDFCDEDRGLAPWGSSVSDRDHATGNVVMQNQVVVRSATEMLTTGPGADAPNYISRNTTVTLDTVVSRPAGCYAPLVYRTDFLAHGASAHLLSGHRGMPYCSSIEVECVDGDLAYSWFTGACRLDQVPFQCQMSNSDGGCSGTASCPSGALLMGAHAACNLELPSVSDGELASVPADVIRVVRASDVVSDGSCWVGPRTVRSGDLGIERGLSVARNAFGCRERDANGGDCQIRGAAYCWYPF